MSLLRLADARVVFGSGAAVALPDMHVNAGERVLVTGRNGAGKSTLLRVLAMLVRAEGRFEAEVPPRDVSLLPQRPYLFDVGAMANVMLALAGRGVRRAERVQRAEEAMARLGASHLAARRPVELSAGELQRVALARALVSRPRVLLLDEPLGPLDAAGADRVLSLFGEPGEMAIVATAPTPNGLANLVQRTVALSEPSET